MVCPIAEETLAFMPIKLIGLDCPFGVENRMR
jgi:hypothetical protein